jgi:hypothetical protein
VTRLFNFWGSPDIGSFGRKLLTREQYRVEQLVDGHGWRGVHAMTRDMGSDWCTSRLWPRGLGRDEDARHEEYRRQPILSSGFRYL